MIWKMEYSAPQPRTRDPAAASTHHNFDDALLVAVPPERMAMFLAPHVDALPAELLDRDERLVHVAVFRDEVRPEVECEPFGMEDVRRGLCQVYPLSGGSRG